MSQLDSRGEQVPTAKTSRRRRIGFITPRISDENGLAIWRGMVEAARARGVDLLCFAGGEVQYPDDRAPTSTRQNAARNAVYDLVDRESLEGVIVWGSSLGYYAGFEATVDFVRRFEPLPMVSIGVAMPGIPGIVLDSYGGIREAMSHLVDFHGRRRLAFIRGPESHREAQQRFRAYCDALTDHGIPFDPDLVSPPYLWVQADGTELRASGEEAVRLFLDERNVQLDAIVAANDTLALGALPALQARGIAVPEQVSLVGFDDRWASRIVSPPLTTLRTGLRERGRLAVSMLLAQLSGERLQDEYSLPAHLVIRRSCGCFDATVTHAGDGTEKLAPQTDRQVAAGPHPSGSLSAEQRAAVLVAMSRHFDTSADGTLRADGAPQRITELLDACLAELTEGANKPGRFLATLDSVLRQASEATDQVWVWQGVISTLREQLSPHLPANGEGQVKVETLWNQARVLIGERARRAQANADRSASEQSERLHAVGRRLALAEDITELMGILAAELPAMGIRSCAVALYEDPEFPVGACRLVLAYDEHGRRTLSTEGEEWPAPMLASGGWLADDRQRSIVIKPLHHRDQQLGFLMLDGSNLEGQLFRVLQEQISSGLKGVLLLQENVRLYNAALAAQQIAQEKQQLAEEADRLKSRFLSMVSHELRTPLILLEGLSEMMLRAGQPLRGDSMSDRPPFPAVYRQDLERMRATSQQLSGLVRDVLDLARSQVGQLRLTVAPLDLAAVLQPTMLIGEQMARNMGLEWQVEIAQDLPQIRGDSVRLQEVTLNLISNAVKFTSEGEVRLRIYPDGNDVIVSVSDTGLGVPVNEQQSIFDEFRQSERTAARGFGGMGVGLAICRQIVSLHDGEIGVESSGLEDGGSTFFFRIPALQAATAGDKGDAASLSPDQVKPSEPGSPPGDDEARATVLLTDRAANGAFLQAYLERRGFEVQILPIEEDHDWQARLLALRPGAIVLDLHDTTWDRGWEMIDTLKLSEDTRGIPILLYSLLVEQGQGAVLALDYLTKPMGAAALSQALQNLGLPEGATIENRTILIADDDPAILALHSDIVAEYFPYCRILTASNGREALEVLERGERPLLLLLDLMMPELDGIGLLEVMQSDVRLRDIPVIVLTARRLSEEDMGRLGRGVSSILQKGMFTTAETLAQIERALARNRRSNSETQWLVHRVMAFIHGNYAKHLSRDEMARYAGVSPRHLTRCFKQEVGLSPISYLNRFRVSEARRLLDEGNKNITEVMHSVGFSDSSYFSRIFQREVGMSPSAYLRHAHGRGLSPGATSIEGGDLADDTP